MRYPNSILLLTEGLQVRVLPEEPTPLFLLIWCLLPDDSPFGDPSGDHRRSQLGVPERAGISSHVTAVPIAAFTFFTMVA